MPETTKAWTAKTVIGSDSCSSVARSSSSWRSGSNAIKPYTCSQSPISENTRSSPSSVQEAGEKMEETGGENRNCCRLIDASGLWVRAGLGFHEPAIFHIVNFVIATLPLESVTDRFAGARN